VVHKEDNELTNKKGVKLMRSGRVLLGLLILGLGVVIILDKVVGIGINLAVLIDYWPVIPLIFGLNSLATFFVAASDERRRGIAWSRLLTAAILIGIGVVYLGRNLGWFIVDTGLLWSIVFALLLIFLGINLLRSKAAGEGRIAFMGGVTVGGSPYRLKSGSYLAFMGGIDLDLATAEIPEGETVLDLTAVMGGIDVTIPPGLPVIYEGSAVLGGITFRDQEDGGIITSRKIEHNVGKGSGPLVRILARAVMGGVEIKEKQG